MIDRLPGGVEYVRTTALFDEEHHPAGLLREHRVADGVWARLLVHSGELTFVFDDRPEHSERVTAPDHVVIPPGERHHVEIDGPVTFALEFHRESGHPSSPPPGQESSGLDPS